MTKEGQETPPFWPGLVATPSSGHYLSDQGPSLRCHGDVLGHSYAPRSTEKSSMVQRRERVVRRCGEEKKCCGEENKWCGEEKKLCGEEKNWSGEEKLYFGATVHYSSSYDLEY